MTWANIENTFQNNGYLSIYPQSSRDIYRTEDNGRRDMGDPTEEFSQIFIVKFHQMVTYFCFLHRSFSVKFFCFSLGSNFCSDALNKIFPPQHKAICRNLDNGPGNAPKKNSTPSYKFRLLLHLPLVTISQFGGSLLH